MKPLRNPFFYLAFVFAIGLGLLVWGVAQAQWQPPSQPFPDGNPNPPVDTSSAEQTKLGILNLGSLGFVGAGGGLCVNDTPGVSPMTCRRWGFDFGWKRDPVTGNIYNLNAGNVGISTSTPTYTLDVDGDIGLTGDIYQNGALFTSGGNNWTLSGNSLYASSTSWNVGIGTQDPGAKLSVQGNLGLVRDPDPTLPPGKGPLFFLQSPSSEVSEIRGGQVICRVGDDSDPLLPKTQNAGDCDESDTAPGDVNTSYQCISSSPVGISWFDIYRAEETGNPDNWWYIWEPLECQAGTSKYSLRTNDGTLEFLNNSGDSGVKMTLNQNGVLTTYGLLTALGGADVTGNLGVDGDASVVGDITASGGGSLNWNTAYGWEDHAAAGYMSAGTDNWVNTTGDTMTGDLAVIGSILTSAGGAFGDGGIYFANHSLNSNSDPTVGNWLYLFDESGDETYGATGLAVGNFSVVGNAYFGLSSSARFRGPVNVENYIYNASTTSDGSDLALLLNDNVFVSGNIDITGGARIADLAGCSGKIYTDAAGNLICGTDASGTSLWLQSVQAGDIYYDSGNVGIRIADPQADLDVSGWIRTSGIRADTVVVDNEIQFLDGTTQSTAAGGGGPRIASGVIYSGQAQAPGGSVTNSNWMCSATITADLCVLNSCDIRKNDDDKAKCYVSRSSINGRQWRACAVAYNDNDTFVQSSMRCMNFSTPGTPSTGGSSSGGSGGGPGE